MIRSFTTRATGIANQLINKIKINVIGSVSSKPEKHWYDRFFGILSAEDISEITEALKDTEKVDTDEW